MIRDSSKLSRNQLLKVDLSVVKDRLPKSLRSRLEHDPIGTLDGYKMVDGNRFGLVLRLSDGSKHWFFEEEVSEIE